MADDIERLRREIDALDDELLKLINRRAAAASRIGKLKAGAPAYRPERESEILRRVAQHNPGPLATERVSAVFRELISACRGLEESIRVSYLGPEGTFSEQAVRQHFGRAVEALPVPSVDEAFRRCEARAVQFTVVPVENSTEGVVGRTLDLLLTTPLRICAEIELRVQQNLLAKGKLKDVRRVYSHPQSLGQCDAWLAQNLPLAERVPVASNAEAAQRAANEAGAAAIAGEAAAERYGLMLLARAIEDAPNNTTRFLVLGELDPAPTGKDRTSLVMSAENKPGAVHALLTPLAEHRVSMTRIESRPARYRWKSGSALWEYVFFIDVEGHQQDAPIAQALAKLRTAAPFLKVLGSYPIAK
ncbi:MAG TPA: prephenate dehydratase [Burkholderiales bacterium]|nr:prephenate dehydratase [Burkholderiales bacterium]